MINDFELTPTLKGKKMDSRANMPGVKRQYVNLVDSKPITNPNPSIHSYACYNPISGIATVQIRGRAGEDRTSDELLDEKTVAALNAVPDESLDETIKTIFMRAAKYVEEKTKENIGGSCFTGTLMFRDRAYNGNVGDSCAFIAELDEKVSLVIVKRLSDAVHSVHEFMTLGLEISKLQQTDEKQASERVEKLTPSEQEELFRLQEIQKHIVMINETWLTGSEAQLAVSRCFGDYDQRWSNNTNELLISSEPAFASVKVTKTLLTINVCDGVTDVLKHEDIQKIINIFLQSKKITSLETLDQNGEKELLTELAKLIAMSAKEKGSRDDISVTLGLLNPKKQNRCVFHGLYDGHRNANTAIYIKNNFVTILRDVIFEVTNEMTKQKQVKENSMQPHSSSLSMWSGNKKKETQEESGSCGKSMCKIL